VRAEARHRRPVGKYPRALDRRRFLEHSRVFYFQNGGSDEVYLASADWMDRNFFRASSCASRCSIRLSSAA